MINQVLVRHMHVRGHMLEHVLGYMLEHVLGHMLEHMLKHMLGHMLEHVLRHVLKHGTGHVPKHMIKHVTGHVPKHMLKHVPARHSPKHVHQNRLHEPHSLEGEVGARLEGVSTGEGAGAPGPLAVPEPHDQLKTKRL